MRSYGSRSGTTDDAMDIALLDLRDEVAPRSSLLLRYLLRTEEFGGCVIRVVVLGMVTMFAMMCEDFSVEGYWKYD